MDLYAVAAVAGLFFVGLLSPGPNVLIVASASASAGRRAGIAAGLGVVLGDVLYACLGIAGLSGAVAASGSLFSVLKVAGGLYILWLGVRMAWGARSSVNGREMLRPNHSWFRRGLMTDLANAHTAVFFASVLVATLSPTSSLLTKVGVVTAVAFVSLAWRLTLALLFSTPLLRRTYERRQRAMAVVAGGILTLTGARIALTR